uniref:Uncharacterized protein n=1 Tax=mine drainage metagenome TaxID=410659 RepID=E6PV14_9ZZZZ
MNIELQPEDRVAAELVSWPLAVDRVLYEAEQPIIFLTHSTAGQPLLAYLAHESTASADYILASASPTKVQQLERGLAGVRESLCADWMWLLRIHHATGAVDLWSVDESAIPNEYLPIPGTGLRPEHSVVFAARAIGDGIALGRMPCSVISLVADAARASLKSVFDYVRAANTEGRPKDSQRALYDLPVQRLRFASFEVGLAEPSAELFGDESIQLAISRLTDGLEWAVSASDQTEVPGQSPEEQEAILRSALALTPPSSGVVNAIEVSGTWLGNRRFHLDRSARIKVNRRLRTLRSERIVVFAGRIGEIDDDNLSFTLRETQDGADHKGAFPEDLLDDMRTHYYESNRVEISGVEVNGRFKATAVVQHAAPSED